MKIKDTEIKVVQENIFNNSEKVEAIVNPVNNMFMSIGGIKDILIKVGEKVQEECKKFVPLKIGESMITTAGKLKYKYIIHTVIADIDFKTNEDYIRLAIRNLLKISEENKVSSISLPPLSCDIENFPYDKTAKIMAEEIVSHINNLPNTSLKKIVFVLHEKKVYEIFKDAIYGHIGYILRKVGKYPIPTVDIIIKVKTKNKTGIVLIERKNPPYGWAIPGGFVEYNESLEESATREAYEETGLKIKNLKQFHAYSEPGRDPRFHTISIVFNAEAIGKPKASSDAKNIVIATKEEILKDKYPLVFDHKKILLDYFKKEK